MTLQTRPSMAKRVAIALSHAPGLWLCYRQVLTRRLIVQNIVHVSATIAACVITWQLAPHWSYTFAVWVIGHMVWGCYLAAHLEEVEAKATG